MYFYFGNPNAKVLFWMCHLRAFIKRRFYATLQLLIHQSQKTFNTFFNSSFCSIVLINYIQYLNRLILLRRRIDDIFRASNCTGQAYSIYSLCNLLISNSRSRATWERTLSFMKILISLLNTFWSFSIQCHTSCWIISYIMFPFPISFFKDSR